MYRIFIALVLALILCQSLPAQKTDRKLQKQVEALVQGFGGVAGIYIKHLPSGKTASVQADTLFPTASMVKIPILIGIMDKDIKRRTAIPPEPVIPRFPALSR
ncbi:serine hydrolase [Flavihumibacter stibioxidans]|uniref:serine hydrolase n=1 Tax=Flavihumibacter stibioxidans TaxID=1834163 RepID=UPI001FEADA92|nr:serine hydrolase [Flavihumibacter stibioxidans]